MVHPAGRHTQLMHLSCGVWHIERHKSDCKCSQGMCMHNDVQLKTALSCVQVVFWVALLLC